MYSVEITQKEPFLVPKTRLYYIKRKARKIVGFFCQIAEFCGGIGGKTSPRHGNSDQRVGQLLAGKGKKWMGIRHHEQDAGPPIKLGYSLSSAKQFDNGHLYIV